MMFNLYALKDKKADYFIAQIIICENDAVAKRNFYEMYNSACDNSPHSPLAAYPEDFELYRIGFFDTCTGVIDSDDDFICSASAFRKEV